MVKIEEAYWLLSVFNFGSNSPVVCTALKIVSQEWAILTAVRISKRELNGFSNHSEAIKICSHDSCFCLWIPLILLNIAKVYIHEEKHCSLRRSSFWERSTLCSLTGSRSLCDFKTDCTVLDVSDLTVELKASILDNRDTSSTSSKMTHATKTAVVRMHKRYGDKLIWRQSY